MSFKPTPEQDQCVEQFATGKRQRIDAYAGAAKTTTLKLIARSTTKFGTYVAFNKSIAEAARAEFPDNVKCSTMHSLAYRAVIRHFENATKLTGSVNGGFLAMKLDLKTRELAPGFIVRPRAWGFLLSETIKRWQRSGRDRIGPWDVPTDGKIGTLPDELLTKVKIMVANEATGVWQKMIDPDSDLPLGHDGYLKLWALTKPTLPGEFILLDEAQDTNGVVLELMRHQTAQTIAVGDRLQQIYEWRGAKNAMVELETDLETRLSQSFRFGAAIAAHATSILECLGETIPLRGNPAMPGSIGAVVAPRAMLFRTNGRLIEELFASLGEGKRPHIIGGVSEIMQYVNGAERLKLGQSVDSPLEFFGFRDWAEVQMISDSEDGTPELRRWVRLIDTHGTQKLRAALERLPKEEAGADVILSTGHKSKG
uniref:UvrD-helicase domain-containing protein n=1 Tax=uncultured Hyphomicrobium sp. TaxID=194373 RepID=UPI0025F69BB4